MKHGFFRTAAAVVAAVFLCLPARAANFSGSVSARSAILVDAQTGRVLYEKNADEQSLIASTTKIMTGLLVCEAGELEREISVPPEAAGVEGSSLYLQAGERITVRELLYGLMLRSGNDAAVALAEHLAGSEDAFVERMNARAQELGMNDTHFVNCTGLPAAGHLTSACDIALMSRELILHHPDIRQFTTIWMDSLRNGESLLVNTNKLVRFYPGTTGLKTGSTSSAGYCISATAEKDGMELIAVVLGGSTSDKRFADAKTL